MNFNELSKPWKRIFELEWISICAGSKAIAAIITDEAGEIISEGRNRIAESTLFPNFYINHAELEAVSRLDITKYPEPKKYTLFAALEPCPMCFGTIVMGKIRHVIIAAKDSYGGAVNMINTSDFIKSKNIQIQWEAPILGEIQRAMQAIREYLKDTDIRRREKTLQHIQILYPNAVTIAKSLINEAYFDQKELEKMEISCIFNEISSRLEKYQN